VWAKVRTLKEKDESAFARPTADRGGRRKDEKKTIFFDYLFLFFSYSSFILAPSSFSAGF